MNKFVVFVAVVAVVAFAKPQHKVYSPAEIAATPASFDAREQWPECKSIGEIVDQGSSGAAWALAAVGAMSDRMCIKNPEENTMLSANDVEFCSDCFTWTVNRTACPWLYWLNTGIVSELCYPTASGANECGKCSGKPSLDWDKDKRKGKSNYTISEEDNMKTELYQNGPFQAVFEVYADFMQYKGGVYEHASGTFEGYHTVKVIGYGEENGVKYWNCANSWGNVWGEKGFFRIRRGNNECNIEKIAYAGLPL